MGLQRLSPRHRLDDISSVRTASVVVVIPARYDSKRLPGKVLLEAGGKSILRHVWERAVRAGSASRVIVATDDARIAEACRSFGAEWMMTSRKHPSGTSRCAQVARRVPAAQFVNVQADEPEIRPAMIDDVARLLAEAPIATLATRFENERDFRNPNRVKVVLDAAGKALYFSRSPIPYDGRLGLLHVGIYGYRREALLRLARLPPHPLELAERLEQLRALANGIAIRVGLVPGPWRGGIDTAADLARFRALEKSTRPRGRKVAIGRGRR
jgi:3-deoxy-D-manno-octulosonate cytidylyltransferase